MRSSGSRVQVTLFTSSGPLEDIDRAERVPAVLRRRRRPGFVYGSWVILHMSRRAGREEAARVVFSGGFLARRMPFSDLRSWPDQPNFGSSGIAWDEALAAHLCGPSALTRGQEMLRKKARMSSASSSGSSIAGK